MVKLTGTRRSDSDPEPVLVDDNGHVYTLQRGICDSSNSTTTPLAANAQFTGTSIDTLEFATISIVVRTDEVSALDGLQVQYSSDDVNWHDGEKYNILANVTKFFTPTLQARYMRVLYKNGPKPQTSFHLHVTLRRTPIKWSSHNIADEIKPEDDATLTRAVQTALKPDGTFDNVALTDQGALFVSLDLKSKELLFRMLQRLERIEFHLSQMTGEDLNDNDLMEKKK
jgi:hypothetical protein